MEKFFSKPVLIGILFFLALLAAVLLAAFWLELGLPSEELQQENVPGSGVPVKSLPSPATKNRVMPDEAADIFPAIIYRGKAFFPAKITVRKNVEKGIECFLRIINEGDEKLTVRLGPYEPGKEKGFPYAAIASGGSAIIDPRYSGITDLIFYNAEEPSDTFAVRTDTNCAE